MLPVPEGDIVERRVDELVFRTFTLDLAHPREAERIELLHPRFVRVIKVHRVRRRA